MTPCLFLLLALFAASPETDGVALPQQTRGDMTARLTIQVADKPVQPGAAAIRLTLTITGGPQLEVEAPRLSDPVNAWEMTRKDVRRQEDNRVVWMEDVQLRQIKPGPVSLPDVMVRFRDDPAAPYQEAEWIDLLKKARDGPPPEPLLPLPSPAQWPSWLRLASVGFVAIIAVGFLIRRWNRSRRSLSAGQRALRDLTRLQQASISPLNMEDYQTQLSDVVRRYLAERYKLPATRQTTAEFLEAVNATGRLSAERHPLLRDLLERCDIAKFAPVGQSPEECREATALARTFVEQTISENRAALARESLKGW